MKRTAKQRRASAQLVAEVMAALDNATSVTFAQIPTYKKRFHVYGEAELDGRGRVVINLPLLLAEIAMHEGAHLAHKKWPERKVDRLAQEAIYDIGDEGVAAFCEFVARLEKRQRKGARKK